VLERYLNSLNGFTAMDDDLPQRFFTEEGSSSPHIMMKPLDRKAFLDARANYYKVRGYDKDGMPTEHLMEKLELGEYL